MDFLRCDTFSAVLSRQRNWSVILDVPLEEISASSRNLTAVCWMVRERSAKLEVAITFTLQNFKQQNFCSRWNDEEDLLIVILPASRLTQRVSFNAKQSFPLFGCFFTTLQFDITIVSGVYCSEGMLQLWISFFFGCVSFMAGYFQIYFQELVDSFWSWYGWAFSDWCN